MSRGLLFKQMWAENRSLNVLVLVLLLANLGIYLFQSQWLDKELFSLRNEVRVRQQSIRQLQQQKNAGSMPVSALTQAETDLKRFQAMIPAEEKLAELLGELYSIATTSRLEIKQVTYVHKLLDDQNLISYDLTFSVTGVYKQLKHFLHLLERTERILIVSDISMSKPQTAMTDDGVALQIKIKTYFKSET